IVRKSGALLGTHQDQPFAVLRDAVIRSIKDEPRQTDVVSRVIEGMDELVEKRLVLSDSQALNVLEHERASPEFRNDPDEFEHQAITRIFERPVADQRKSLTGRAAKNAIYGTVAD